MSVNPADLWGLGAQLRIDSIRASVSASSRHGLGAVAAYIRTKIDDRYQADVR